MTAVLKPSLRARGPTTPRGLSVQAAAALALGLLGALGTALTVGLVGEVAGRRLEAQVGQEVAATAAFMAHELDQGMFARWRDVQVLAALDQVRLATTGPAQRRRVLESLKATLPDYAWLGVTDAEGRVQAATGGLLVGQDVSARPWFQAARQGPTVQDVHEAKLLAPFLSRSGEPPRFVDVATPLLGDDGQLIGVLGAHLYWDWVAEVERALRSTLPEEAEDAEILVVSQAGQVLLGPREAVGSMVKVASEQGWHLENGGEEDRIVGTAPTEGYREYPGLGWTVVVARDAADALAPVAALRRDLLVWGLGLTLILAGLAWFLAGVLTRPFTRLADAAAALGAGRAPTPLASGPRELLSVGQEISQASTELARRSAELTRSEGFLRSVLDASVDCIKVVEFDGRLTFMNANGCRAMEIDDVGTVQGRPWPALWPAEAASLVQGALAAAARGESTRFQASCPTAKGTPRWWDVAVAPVPGPDGRPVRTVAVSRDITAEREAAERETLLAREVDHRAKNLLAVVQSVVQLTRADDASTFAQAVGGRIRSLARAHSLLAASRWDGADLRQIVDEEMAPYAEKAGWRVRVSGPVLKLKPEAAQALALVIHELATNAAKYGALSVPEGELEIDWRVDTGDDQLSLRWRERAGPPVSPPMRRGFGSKVIRASVEVQLGGTAELDWSPDGLQCELVLPAERAVLLDARPAARAPRSRIRQDDSVARPAGSSVLNGRRVLVVEDEALIAMEIEAVLVEEGCEVLGPIATVPDALHRLQAVRPDVALLDVHVAGERSFAVADLLTAERVPFAFATGFEAATALPERFQGAVVVNKPFAEGEIVSALRRAFESASSDKRPPAASQAKSDPLAQGTFAGDAPPLPG